jgi:hypothetical protein
MGDYDRSAHHKGSPGFTGSADAVKSPPHDKKTAPGEGNGMEGSPDSHAASSSYGSGEAFIHKPPAMKNAHVFCGTGPMSGRLRMSGVKGAHRIGKK